MRIDTERNGLRVGLEGPSLREVPSDDATENPLQVRFQLGLDLGPQAVEKIGDGTHDGTGRCRCIINFEIEPASLRRDSLDHARTSASKPDRARPLRESYQPCLGLIFPSPSRESPMA